MGRDGAKKAEGCQGGVLGEKVVGFRSGGVWAEGVPQVGIPPLPLNTACLSACPVLSPPVCPGLSAGPAPPWTVAVSPTFSSPRLPCQLSGPPVTGPDPSSPQPRACPAGPSFLISHSPPSTSQVSVRIPLMKNLAETSQPDVPATCLLGREGLLEGG